MNPMDIFKNLSQLQEGLKQSQEKLGSIQVTGSAGGDMVAVTINGSSEPVSVRIDKEAIDPDDPKMLEDLVLAALRDANAKLKERLNQEVGSIGGLDSLKGMLGL